MAKRSSPTTTMRQNTPAEAAQKNGQRFATDEPLVGPTDVALVLGVPVSWVYAKSEAGELPRYKLGHYVRFKLSEIEEYLRKCRSNGAPRV